MPHLESWMTLGGIMLCLVASIWNRATSSDRPIAIGLS